MEGHGILVEHWPAENFQPRIRWIGSVPAHSAGAKAGSGAGQAFFLCRFYDKIKAPFILTVDWFGWLCYL